jgi:hypothetical protein
MVCWQILPDMIGANGQLPMAPVHQHSEADQSWAADSGQRVKSSPNCPAAVQDIVNKHHDPVINAPTGNLRGRGSPVPTGGEVVPIHRDIEGPCGNGDSCNVRYVAGQPVREDYSPRRNTE